MDQDILQSLIPPKILYSLSIFSKRGFDIVRYEVKEVIKKGLGAHPNPLIYTFKDEI